MFVKRVEYAKAYQRLKAEAPKTSCAVLLFVALDADALCACKMLSSLLKTDFIPHKIHPIIGYSHLETANRELIEGNDDLRFLIMINCGALVDISKYISITNAMKVYCFDSHRPWGLVNAFADAVNVFVFDDGEIEDDMAEVGKAFRGLVEQEASEDEEEGSQEEEPIVHEEDGDREDDDEADDHQAKDGETGQEGGDSGLGIKEGGTETKEQNGDTSDGLEDGNLDVRPRKRKRSEPPPLSKRQRRRSYEQTIAEYYDQGTWHGDSVAGQVYAMLSELGVESNDYLWCAIVGVTFMETQHPSTRQKYMQMYSVLRDEATRLNPPLPNGDGTAATKSNGKNPSDYGIRMEMEHRFMLVRHWSLYDAMLHSPYLGARLCVWSDSGRRKLNKMLAKMGFSLTQCRQVYSHMDMDLRRALRERLERYAPLYGCDDITFPSFVRTFGYKCTLSASDAAYAMTALMEHGLDYVNTVDKENQRPTDSEKTLEAWKLRDQQWVDGFWDAYDALNNVDVLRKGLTVAMELQRAVVRTGTALIDKHNIKNLRSFRMACVKEGPDVGVFTHPLALTRLALWIAEAINVGFFVALLILGTRGRIVKAAYAVCHCSAQ